VYPHQKEALEKIGITDLPKSLMKECKKIKGADAGVRFDYDRTGKSPDWTMSLSCYYPEEYFTRPRRNYLTGEFEEARYPKPPPFDREKIMKRVEAIAKPHEIVMVEPITGSWDRTGFGAWIRSKSPDSIPAGKIQSINKDVVGALKQLGSRCNLEHFLGESLVFGCDHEKDDDYIFRARRGEEDDDFPDFVGKDTVIETVKKAVPFATKVQADDSEKGYYSVSVFLQS